MTMNIEEYLNGLPANTISINIPNMGLTYLPNLSRFTNLIELHCPFNSLTTLPPLPPTLKILEINNNKLTSLPPLPEWLILLVVSSNKLTSLPPLNKCLIQLICNDNQLITLPGIPDTLEYLYCFDNKLASLPDLKNIQTIRYYRNPIYHIVSEAIGFPFVYYDDDNTNQVINIIAILNKFKMMYYSLKYKKQFRDFLWLKIRERNIRKHYHPENLKKLLSGKKDPMNSEEFDQLLNNW